LLVQLIVRMGGIDDVNNNSTDQKKKELAKTNPKTERSMKSPRLPFAKKKKKKKKTKTNKTI
jgi:hypothetical protein